MVREMLPIEEEMERNRKGNCRIIGLTVETRPDQISPKELRLIRSLGSTRIQFGVQSSDNDVLNRNNRKCSIERAMRGLKTAVVNGFKIDCHWMPDLPGSNPEIDRKILDDAVRNPNLRADQLKIYPCQVLNDTLIYEWYTKGEYKPYAETEEGFQQLIDILLEFKQKLPPWIRTNRIVRDFPKAIIRGGLNVTHLNDVLLKLLAKKGLRCKCIRCREIKRNEFEMNDVKLLVRKYRSYDGDEYFISFELFEDEDVSTLAEFTEYDEFNNPTNPNFKDGKWILGFCRLRLNGESKANFPELENCALIRELHVYGTTTDIGQHSSHSVQHRGFGKRMMKKAEEIAKENGWNKMAVIAGIGTQDYYAKLGYDDGFYMTKNL
jgi:histone acetyltransferase (RNA polymerase elongator complex component)